MPSTYRKQAASWRQEIGQAKNETRLLDAVDCFLDGKKSCQKQTTFMVRESNGVRESRLRPLQSTQAHNEASTWRRSRVMGPERKNI
jgi:hypothetical protein